MTSGVDVGVKFVAVVLVQDEELKPEAAVAAFRLRPEAKECILQSMVEDCAKLVDGARVDLWREPDSKDDPGWRGPASSRSTPMAASASWTRPRDVGSFEARSTSRWIRVAAQPDVAAHHQMQLGHSMTS